MNKTSLEYIFSVLTRFVIVCLVLLFYFGYYLYCYLFVCLLVTSDNINTLSYSVTDLVYKLFILLSHSFQNLSKTSFYTDSSWFQGDQCAYSYSHPPRHTYYTIVLTGERKQTTPIFNPGLIVKCIITLRIFYCVIFVHFNFLIRYRKCLVRSDCSKLYPPGRDSRGRDCMVVGYTTTYSISSYHH